MAKRYLISSEADLRIESVEEVESDDPLGKVAYEAYCQQTGWKSLATGDPLPAWVDQGERIRLAWGSAALAVMDAVLSTTQKRNEAREADLSAARRMVHELHADAMVAHRWFEKKYGERMNGRDFKTKCSMVDQIDSELDAAFDLVVEKLGHVSPDWVRKDEKPSSLFNQCWNCGSILQPKLYSRGIVQHVNGGVRTLESTGYRYVCSSCGEASDWAGSVLSARYLWNERSREEWLKKEPKWR